MDPNVKVIVDTMWVLITAMLVFFMNLGFAAVESGFARAKNCVNIMSKNFIVFAVSSLGFLVLGWGLMFGDGSGWIGLKGLFFASGADNSPATGEAYKGVYSAISWAGVPFWAKFFFQLVFCGTAATIVSGAVCERIKYVSFIVFSFVMAMFIYPVVGHWVWGGGWLAKLGMFDFAGSTVVHSVGGWAALAGVIILGPRIGKYDNGKIKAIPGHNLALATLGTFVLWFGWFGFNPGSTMAADPNAISHVAVTTNTAAAAGHHDRDDCLVAPDGQARPGNDPQRLPGRPGGDHGSVCVRQRGQLDAHRPDRRRARGAGGDDLRPAASG